MPCRPEPGIAGAAGAVGLLVARLAQLALGRGRAFPALRAQALGDTRGGAAVISLQVGGDIAPGRRGAASRRTPRTGCDARRAGASRISHIAPEPCAPRRDGDTAQGRGRASRRCPARTWDILLAGGGFRSKGARPTICRPDVHRARVSPVTHQHAEHAACLDWSHRDPWDRILAAQASLENSVLLSTDSVFDAAGVDRHW